MNYIFIFYFINLLLEPKELLTASAGYVLFIFFNVMVINRSTYQNDCCAST